MSLLSTPPLTDQSVALDPARLRAAKPSYTTRQVDLDRAVALLSEAVPAAGDLVLAVVTEVGQHQRIELPDGRRASLFPGDEVVVAYGNRYAPDQFEAVVPGDLGPCQLAAAGGIASRVLTAHGKMSTATSLQPVGLLLDAEGHRLTVASGRLAPVPAQPPSGRPVTVVVAGTSMNAGKTTTAAHLVRGLRRAGLRVGAAKVTGTGAGGDAWLLTDAGAFPTYDFTHAGYPSTYLESADTVLDIFVELQDRLALDGCEVVVVEVADGVYQQETGRLLTDPRFLGRVDAVLFAACDALAAFAGASWLRDRGVEPLALAGVVSSSPLATREASGVTGLPVWALADLSDPQRAEQVFRRLRDGRNARPGATPQPDPGRETALAFLSDSDGTDRDQAAPADATAGERFAHSA